MEITQTLKTTINQALGNIGIAAPDSIHLEHPALEQHGDYSTNVALTLFPKLPTTVPQIKVSNPRELAERIISELNNVSSLKSLVSSLSVAGPGFINFHLKPEYLLENLTTSLLHPEECGKTSMKQGKKIMVEFAHPNTHKELHIGHMRTLTTGEAIARILEANGAQVFRANYQGDIGPHVAKAIWGTQQLINERSLSWEGAESFDHYKKAHLLGEGYVRGNQDYEQHKTEIDQLNAHLYQKDPQVYPIYEQTRRWSLEYYHDFYTRFGTHFDKLYFESQVADEGKQLILDHIGSVFTKSNDAIIFEGEKFGLHSRVFITAQGNPTYEGKDIALAKRQSTDFPFDQNIHVVANEQAGYFQVVIKAIEQVFPHLKDKEYHLSMGMVQLVGQKMSSRTGVIVTVDSLLDEIKTSLRALIKQENLSPQEREQVLEINTIGAVKYSVLKVHPTANVLFDLKQSISLDGNSGPYLQYTYARTKSVIQKFENGKTKFQPAESSISNFQFPISDEIFKQLNQEELSLLRYFPRFPEVIAQAATDLAPSHICTYLYDLAQRYNTFYNKHTILQAENEEIKQLRLALTQAAGQILKNGLYLLGIEAPERM